MMGVSVASVAKRISVNIRQHCDLEEFVLLCHGKSIAQAMWEEKNRAGRVAGVDGRTGWLSDVFFDDADHGGHQLGQENEAGNPDDDRRFRLGYFGVDIGDVRFGRAIGLDHRNIDFDGGHIGFQLCYAGFHAP
ncbi:hypothetical protein [Massilia frigida]|uniref:hypothetical protein n=1 Tax=Massilia frigida TaxID=2609281 RepID=UPI00142098C6|nr:hypothetical protein [Massilia frigida]